MLKKTIKGHDLFQSTVLAFPVDENKFSYALKKVSKKVTSALSPIIDAYNESISDKSIELASVDEKGNLLYLTETITEPNGTKKETPTQNLKFTPAKLNELNTFKRKEYAELFKKEVEIEPYIVSDENIPELTEEQIEAFEGYVIPVGYQNPAK